MKTCITLCLLLCSQIFPENQIIYFSTPRSGTHFLSYVLTKLTGRKVIAYDGIRFNKFPCDENKQGIWHSHSLISHPIKVKTDPKSDYLIALIRDPIEATYRDFLRKLTKKQATTIDLSIDVMSNSYIYILNEYDNWNPSKRILIKYCDLIDDKKIEDELVKILQLIGEYQKPTLDKFIQNIEQHRLDSLKQMESDNYPSITKGKSSSYHRKSINKDQIQAIQKALKAKNSYILDQYLKQFFD